MRVLTSPTMMASRHPRAFFPAPRRKGRSAGFTVMEVVAASFVLVLAISSALAVIQTGFRALDLARSTTAVSQVLQSEIETVRLMSWGEVEKLPEEAAVDAAWTYQTETDLPLDLNVVRRVVPVATEDNLRRIIVTATWKTVDGLSHTRSTATEYCKDGLNDYYATVVSE